jgi:hypothetical protein
MKIKKNKLMWREIGQMDTSSDTGVVRVASVPSQKKNFLRPSRPTPSPAGVVTTRNVPTPFLFKSKTLDFFPQPLPTPVPHCTRRCPPRRCGRCSRFRPQLSSPWFVLLPLFVVVKNNNCYC